MKFQFVHRDSKSGARAGLIKTDRGEIPTPIFMPVGTMGTVKAIHQRELEKDIDAKIVLGNTYHLNIRPGLDIISKAGGLHRFMGWPRPILTDSGGYQVYSLAGHRKIEDDGVRFRSHVDGTMYFFTPENNVDIQRVIGADIMMAFDECTPYPCGYDYADRSMHMTHRWLDRCLRRFDCTEPFYGHGQALFPIVQGSTYRNLRVQSAEYVAQKNREGYAIGGLSVGEPVGDMYAMTDLVCGILPCDKPRYLMGVGMPENLLECIALGVDMFDCVIPTRNARNGMIFTTGGIINIRNKKWRGEFSPIDAALGGYVSSFYSKAYLRHLIISNEMLGAQIASIQNLSFYLWLVRQARQQILNNTFASWKNVMVERVSQRL